MRLAVFLLLASCTGNGSAGPSETFVELANEGVACIARGESLVAGEPAQIHVDWEGVCLSSSCTRESRASCTVSVAGSTVTIETSASWFDTSRAAQECTADCGLLAATCTTPPLPAGEYTFVLGGKSTNVAVPSAVAARCIR